MKLAWRAIAWGLAFACTVPAPAAAQSAPNRYELGQRMRRLERAIEAAMATPEWTLPYRDEFDSRFEAPRPVTPEAAAHRALARAVKAYFALNPSEVARWLDTGYECLLGATSCRLPVHPDTRQELGCLKRALAATLQAPRWNDAEKRPTWHLTWPGLYDWAAIPAPDSIQPRRIFQINLVHETWQPLRVYTGGTKPGGSIKWPDDWGATDAWLILEECIWDRKVEIGRQRVSWIPKGKERLSQVRSQFESQEELGLHQRATLEFQLKMLETVAGGQVFETDLPAHRMLGEVESLLEAESLHAWLTGRSGEFWLALRGERNGKLTGRAHLRVFVPPHSEEGTKRPCVLALHGMGGSENLFFDGYGAGKIVDLCRERGWVLIAPRAGFSGIGMPCEQVWEALAEPLGIDRDQLVVIGHSMGVSAAFAALRENPEGYRAVAAVAGGGPKLRKHPAPNARFLIVTGSEDFALRQARVLSNRLKDVGANQRYLELSGVEHLGAVQFGLPSVFQFFDECLGR